MVSVKIENLFFQNFADIEFCYFYWLPVMGKILFFGRKPANIGAGQGTGYWI